MSLDGFEQKLLQAPLPEPPSARAWSLLVRARRERRWRCIEHVWRWTLVAAAALLVIINLHFTGVHEQQMMALVGPPAIERPLDAKAYVQRFERHQRLLLAWATGNFPSDLREDAL